jgi:hypothetical protein
VPEKPYLLLVGKNCFETVTDQDIREAIPCTAEEIVDLGWLVD